MTEKKKKNTTEKKQTITKASTGAWWKAIVPEIKKAKQKSDTLKEAASTEPAKPIPHDSRDQPSRETLPPVALKPADAPHELRGTEQQQQEELPQAAAGVSGKNVGEAQARNSPVTPQNDPQPDSADGDSRPIQEATDENSPAPKLTDTAAMAPLPDNDKQPEEKPQKGKKQARKKTEDKQNQEGSEKEDQAQTEKPVLKKLLINAEEPEECRIALVEDGKLESFHVTTVSGERTKNNIYKGTIVSIEPNLQAAFVDMGTGRNGFLPFNEIHPEYYRHDISERNRQLVAQHQWKKLKIEDMVKKGQEVLVQVVKEVTGNKGANMTTYLSLPGRFLVLMPGSDSAGISRKITEEERRSDLRQMMASFKIPEGIGYIIRTASADITKTAFQKDLRYLLRLWDEIKTKGQEQPAPALVYEEENTIIRFLRDHYTPEISEIHVDTPNSNECVKNYIRLLPASQRKVKIKMHRGAKPIFNQYNIEEQIESIFKPQVTLPSGGSIVINPTEALVAIDVNSGRTSKNADFEETIFLANMEAAAELARQLRLRDLGGLIVVDFIDMRNKKHVREVERQVRQSMKRDKAKADTSRISRFGLMQISRQKMGAPIEKASYRPCPHCQGRGIIRSVETQALFYLRRIQTGISKKKINQVTCQLPLDISQYLLNKKRAELVELEQKHSGKIEIIPCSDMHPGENRIDFSNAVVHSGEENE
ncbi:MAG: ribonuclease E [Desulfobulbus propionicus]|nr:MAG: ribonuclease E [Desulfobulbus propionicus]